MCGIAGIVSHVRQPNMAALERMLKMLEPRGPDGQGTYTNDHLAFGMQRLAIIDPDTGWQPLYNERKTIVCVVNGEIYNYRELRQELESQGHNFRTGSDCETIPHLYERYGLDFVSHLRGMFALALFDTESKTLVLARDRMGEKPLYICQSEHGLAFASELKAIASSGLSSGQLDSQALAEVLTYGFVVEPRTPFQDIRKLEAARMLVINVETGAISERVYWSAFDAPEIEVEDQASTLQDVLEDVGRLTARSDVPVGVALSGGVDSSLVACLVGKNVSQPFTAFSMAYADGAQGNDESDDAQWLAGKKGWQFERVVITDSEALDSLDTMLEARDDPMIDITGLCYYLLNSHARSAGVPVMIYGHGGDELFWGYRWVRMAAAVNRLVASQSSQSSLTALPWLSFVKPAGYSPLDLGRWALKEHLGLRTTRKILRATQEASPRGTLFQMDDAFAAITSGFPDHFSQSFSNHIDWAKLNYPLGSRLSELGGDLETMRLIFGTYLMQNGIAQGDRLGMCSSVETRLPLVDYRLVETVVGLKKTKSDLHLPAKTLLQRAAKELLPAEIFNRPKRGFAPPVKRWIETLRQLHGDELLEGILVRNGLISRDQARSLRDGQGPKSGAFPLHYRALMLEKWLQTAEKWVEKKLWV